MSAVRREPYVLFAGTAAAPCGARSPPKRPVDVPTCCISIISIRSSTPTPCPMSARASTCTTSIRAWPHAPPTRRRAAFAGAILPARPAARTDGAARRTQGAHDHGGLGRRRRTFRPLGRHASWSCPTASTARPTPVRPRHGPARRRCCTSARSTGRRTPARRGFSRPRCCAAVRRRVPDARVMIVGKNPPPEVLALARSQPQSRSPANVSRRRAVLPQCARARGAARGRRRDAAEDPRSVRRRPAGRQHAVGCEGIDAAARASTGRRRPAGVRGRASSACCSIPAAARDRADRAQQLARDDYDWAAVGPPRRRRGLGRVRRDRQPAGTLQALAVQAEMPIR